MKQKTREQIERMKQCYPKLSVCERGIVEAMEAIVSCYKEKNKVMTCGNGGSAADALHIVGELMKSFAIPRKLSGEEQEQIKQISRQAEYLNANLQKAVPALSLVNEVSLLTAYANDVAAELNFAQQVYGYGQKGDVLIAISTSGNSKNILYACEIAKVKKMKSIALTGKMGGNIVSLADIVIQVPEIETYKIQELHLPVYHTICLAVEQELFGKEEKAE